jgi:hypothetical protein
MQALFRRSPKRRLRGQGMSQIRYRVRGALLLAFMLLLAGCGGRGVGGSAVPSVPSGPMQMPKSVSPASIPAPPMARTAPQSAAEMNTRRPKSVIAQLGWTQLPGGAVAVAASPDGSIWVLSTQGTGTDQYIYHYMNGAWTNIPGAAIRLAVAPDGTLWVVNSAGGIYAYNGSSWSVIAGGASDVTAGSDGSVYVISNQGGGPYGRGIWHYSAGSWTQLPGAAVRIAASWDLGTYPFNIGPGGFYVANALNGVFYYNPSYGFTQLPGGVVQLAPTKNGGLFALGYIANGDGSYPIYYNDVSTGIWTQQPGAAVSIATDSLHVYAIGAAGGIYSAPVMPVNQTLSANPMILAFPSNGSFGAQTVAISGGANPYSTSVADNTIAQASVAGSTLTVAPVLNPQTSQYNAGPTTVTITDAANSQVTIQVGVTTATVVVESRRASR